MNQIKGIRSPLSQSQLPNISYSYMKVKIDATFVVPPIMESQVKFHQTWQQYQWNTMEYFKKETPLFWRKHRLMRHPSQSLTFNNKKTSLWQAVGRRVERQELINFFIYYNNNNGHPMVIIMEHRF